MRICDNGGWTDTWFARYGSVFHVAVSPFVEVELEVQARSDSAAITINALDYGDVYSIERPNGIYQRHKLLEAAFDLIPIPSDVSVKASIHCDVPGGCSTGTSAAVTVALLGALDCLTPGRMTQSQLAKAAHRAEFELLGQQSGIQD